MLKCRVIPILTFNGFGLVKTKQFNTNPRMVGNAVQAAKVYNSRNVDELVFLDIYATKQKRKINLRLTKQIIDECLMPVAVGGGIETLQDIQDLLDIGADKVIINSKMITNPEFINAASDVYGNQCITLAIDVVMKNEEYFLHNDLELNIPLFPFLVGLENHNFGEIILTSVDRDGMMNGFDVELVKHVQDILKVPIVVAGGAGNPSHVKELFSECSIQAVAAASVFHFTQYTPNDLKVGIRDAGKSARIVAINT